MKLKYWRILVFVVAAFHQPAISAAEEPIRIGTLAPGEGEFASFGVESLRGVELALRKWNDTAGGRKIEWIKETSGDTPKDAEEGARRLVEEHKVDFVIGPMKALSGLAVRDYAKTQPAVTFLNGSSAHPDLTLRDQAQNFFRFSMDSAQWMGGLGQYAFHERGYKKVATLAEDYHYGWSQVRGFLQDFCNSGGKLAKSLWVPLGASNEEFAEIARKIPTDIDAIFIPMGAWPTRIFLTEYELEGGKAPLIAGTITLAPKLHRTRGARVKYLMRTPSSGPVAEGLDTAEWQSFENQYKTVFPRGYLTPTLFSYGYYVNTIALLTALDAVDGDLSDGHKRLRGHMAKMTLSTPTGAVQLDENRQVIGNVQIAELLKGGRRKPYRKYVKSVSKINQSLNGDPDKYLQLGPLGKQRTNCEQ